MNSVNFQKFLLDTNAVIALTQQESSDDKKVVIKIASLQKNTKLYISILSIYEMEYGAAHASESITIDKTKLAIQLLKTEDKITILPLTMQGAQIFGERTLSHHQSNW